MLDLRQYTCLGAALRDALDRFASEVCLIEAERDREKLRLTYSDFKEIATPLTRALEDADFDPGERCAIIMTNQSKWLISAYAVFYCGGVLVPLDYKLSAAEHLQLLAHSKAKVLMVEYHLWRAITESPEFQRIGTKLVLVTEAPPGADLAGAFRWEDFKRKGTPDFVMRQKDDVACIVYSSGTGGRPKGCVLTHENYLEQCRSLTAWYPFWPGVRYLSILPTNHAIDFMVGFIGPFVCGACVVHLRTLRPEFVRDAFVRYRITYVALVPMIVKNLERGLRAKFEELPSWKRAMLNMMIGVNRTLTRRQPKVKLSRKLLAGVHTAFGGELLAVFTGGAFMEPSTIQFFYDLGVPVINGYGLTEAGTALTLNDLKPFRADTVGKPLPGVAQVAMQQGRYAGKVVHTRITGSTPPGPFSYFDKGTMAVVGKGFAVLQSYKLRISGFVAWLAWAFVHLQFLATSSLRLTVCLQWVWTYFTGQRGSRLIVNHHAPQPARAAEDNPSKSAVA